MALPDGIIAALRCVTLRWATVFIVSPLAQIFLNYETLRETEREKSRHLQVVKAKKDF